MHSKRHSVGIFLSWCVIRYSCIIFIWVIISSEMILQISWWLLCGPQLFARHAHINRVRRPHKTKTKQDASTLPCSRTSVHLQNRAEFSSQSSSQDALKRPEHQNIQRILYFLYKWTMLSSDRSLDSWVLRLTFCRPGHTAFRCCQHFWRPFLGLLLWYSYCCLYFQRLCLPLTVPGGLLESKMDTKRTRNPYM